MGANGPAKTKTALLLALLWVAGCSNDPGTQPACPREQAAFRLQVTARGRPVPPDLSLTVRYQGNQSERFVLADPDPDNEDVCCRPGARVAGALPEVPCRPIREPDGGPVEAVSCELWTNGVADVRVTGGDYPPLEQVLDPRPRQDDCGLETVDVRLMLAHTDGGLGN